MFRIEEDSILNGQSITQFKARLCRDAGLTLPEARALEYSLTHPLDSDFKREYSAELIARLERKGYLVFDGLFWNISPDGFRVLEKCFE
jgi:hypothetical protein